MKKLALSVIVLGAGLYGLTIMNPAHPAPLPPIATATSSLEATATTTPAIEATSTSALFHYIEIVNSCGPYFDGGPCVNMRSGPSTSSPTVSQLRNGMILKVASTTQAEGHTWYQIGFDGWIRYPERVASSWWVAADFTRSFEDPGPQETDAGINASSTKKIVIKRSENTLYAYNGDTLFMQAPVSVGLADTPTPRGTFWIYRKTPDRYMQGPLPGISDQYYDLPGVPWDMYFTFQGGAIHGTYWHNHFGQPWSHGCVNLSVDDAKKLYDWAPLGTPVIVEN